MAEKQLFFAEAYIRYIVPECSKKGLLCNIDKDYFCDDLKKLGYKQPDGAECDFYLINDSRLGYIILCNNYNKYNTLRSLGSDSLLYLFNTYGRQAMGDFMNVNTQNQLYADYIASNTYKDVAFYILPMEDYETTIKYIADRKQSVFIANVKNENIADINEGYFKETYLKYIITTGAKSGLLCDSNKDYFCDDLKRLGYKQPDGAECDFYLINDSRLGYVILYKDNADSMLNRISNDSLLYLFNTYGRQAMGDFENIRTPKSYIHHTTSNTYKDVDFYIIPMEDYETTIKYIVDKKRAIEL